MKEEKTNREFIPKIPTDTTGMIPTGKIFGSDLADQVLFIGEEARMYEYKHRYPSTGAPHLYNIICGEPHMMGLLKKEIKIKSIESWRIVTRPILYKGKRTLVVLADPNSIDVNRSFLDIVFQDLLEKLNTMATKLKHAESRNIYYQRFLEEKDMARSWEEWMLDMHELLRVAGLKHVKPETPSVSVDVGKKDDKKKKARERS